MKTMLFNPYSGKPRDPRDIASDPEGILVIDPDEPLMAAQPAAQEPAAFMYQHDETGQIGFVDVQQVEWGFWKNNPRLREIGPLYLAQPAAQEAPEAAWQPIATAPTDATRIMLAVFRPDLRADPSDFYLLATWDGEASHPFVPNNWTHWMRLPANPNAAQPAAQEPKP